MAYFAEIDSSNNTVIRTVVINDNDVAANGGNNSAQAEEWVKNNIPQDLIVKRDLYNNETYPETYWKQTYKDGSSRKQYATQGYTWDENKQIFIAPKPNNNYILDENNDWIPPIPYCMNDSEGNIEWDDENIRWITTDGTKYYDADSDSWITI